MRLVWISDIHLDHATPRTVKAFMTRLLRCGPEWILVGGDIGEGPTWLEFLRQMRARTGAQIAFVLGNHDYYRSSIRAEQAKAFNQAGPIWLDRAGPIALTPTTTLIGMGGIGDGTRGLFGGMRLRDFDMIEELRCYDPHDMKKRMQELGGSMANRLRDKLRGLSKAESVMILTHVPPWTSAAWHEDQEGDEIAQPFFVWGQGGDVIKDWAQAHPKVRVTVLCGHSHTGGMFAPLPNLTVLTARARYKYPDIAQVMEIA